MLAWRVSPKTKPSQLNLTAHLCVLLAVLRSQPQPGEPRQCGHGALVCWPAQLHPLQAPVRPLLPGAQLTGLPHHQNPLTLSQSMECGGEGCSGLFVGRRTEIRWLSGVDGQQWQHRWRRPWLFIGFVGWNHVAGCVFHPLACSQPSLMSAPATHTCCALLRLGSSSSSTCSCRKDFLPDAR